MSIWQQMTAEMTQCVNIREILANPVQRRKLITRCIVAIQAREGIETTIEQAESAYDAVVRR